MNNENSNILSINSIKNRQNKKQQKFDKELKTVCIKCQHILDANEYYGSSIDEIKKGEYYFCKQNKLKKDGYTFLNPVTGERMISDIEYYTEEGTIEGENYCIDEPGILYQQCLDINKGKCKDYKEN